jgi:nucleoid-associated protein YgaU
MVLGQLPEEVRSEVVPVAAIGSSPAMMSVIEQPATARRQQEYKAMPGDTVSRIARKYYGSDSKANCTLIIAANPSLKANPNKIVVGKTYVVPMKEAPATSAAPTASAQAQTTPAPAVAAAQVAPTAPVAAAAATVPPTAPAANRTYVVKSGDSLWKIANSQCKDPNAMAAIRSLNKDVLKKGDALSVGMKLRLPN